jgi:Holliday junction DNA helicase RuvB
MTERRKTEIGDVAPTSLKHMIGQQNIMAQVAVAIDAAFADDRRFEHSLLTGPPGIGKSQTARIIAAEMASDLLEVLGQSITSAADLNALLLAAKDKAIVHIDESHELEKEFQTALYLATDQRRIVLNSRSKAGPQSIPLADFTLLLSTTDEFCLLQPLRDRMRLVLRFDFYSAEELTVLLHQRSRALGWQVHEELLPLIARRARGTPRLALRLLQACRRVCSAGGESMIIADHLHRACELEQIDDIGLGPTEQRYLAVLGEGACRLNVVASMLGLPGRTVSLVVEPFLLRSGLIVKDDAGRRELTAMGREHLSSRGCHPTVSSEGVSHAC